MLARSEICRASKTTCFAIDQRVDQAQAAIQKESTGIQFHRPMALWSLSDAASTKRFACNCRGSTTTISTFDILIGSSGFRSGSVLCDLAAVPNLACQLPQSQIASLPSTSIRRDAQMELQHSVTTPTNLSPFLATIGPHERLESIRVIDRDSADLGQIAALLDVQPVERPVTDPESAAKELFADNESPALRPGDDYACATDEQLIAAAKIFDGRAFEELSNRHIKSIRKAAYRIVRNPEDAEDVVQDSLLKAYCSLPEFKESCRFSTWIIQIAVNTALMLLRRKKVRSEASLVRSDLTDKMGWTWDVPDPSPSTEQRVATQETRKLLLLAVKRLPPISRNVLEQFHLQERSMREAADTLGISVASAKSRLFRARRLLRSRLERKRFPFLTTVSGRVVNCC